MRGRQWVFLAPCSNPAAQKHLRDTILNGVRFADIEEYLEERDKAVLRDRDPLRIWGNVPGKRKGWEDMEVGDLVLFYQLGKFTHAGKVYHKIDNDELSKRLWPDYKDGKPWRYIYFLQEIKEVDVPLTLVKKYSGYDAGFVPMGFTTLRSKAVDAITQDHESVEAFVQKYSEHKETFYFVLITGSTEYKDEPRQRYHFKEGIPGSRQLRNAENRGKFVYYENGKFYAKGEIGEITSYEENDVTYYYAEVKNFEEIGPIDFEDTRKDVSFSYVGQAGINKISEEDYNTIIARELLSSTFVFTEKDFLSCTGKKADARYLNERFKTLLNVLKENLDPDFSLAFTKSYVARPFNQGSKKYRKNMWLGLAHDKLEDKPQKCIQFQVSINSNDPFSIDIFIDRAGRDMRRKAKSNIEKKKSSFLELIHNLTGYLIGYTNKEYSTIETDKMMEDDLDEFLEHMDDGGTYVYISKNMNKEETINKGPLIASEIISAWKQMLPLYKIMAFGEFEETVVTILPLALQPSLIKTELKLQPDVLNQVCANLNAGSHIIITGPVGTGKTTLAEEICTAATNSKFCNGYVLTTATSDWTTFDTIGGYMPTEERKLRFEEGKFLGAIRENKWLIIDEINRADIDKAFGQLFTVLSGQRVELPFKHATGKTISIETTDEEKSYFDDEQASYKVGKNWRIISTMNVYDKSFLFEMSYAFMRRFAFVYLDVPERFEDLIAEWCKGKKISAKTREKLKLLTKLGERKIGPAIIKDVVDYLEHRGDGEKELAEAIIAYILPQLEGLEEEKIRRAWDKIGQIFENKDVPSSVIKSIFSEIVGFELKDVA